MVAPSSSTAAASRAGGPGPADLAATLLVVVVWALNFIAGKDGLSEFPPLLMLALRFALVGLLLAPFLRRLPQVLWPQMLAVSLVFGTGHFGLMFTGLSGVDASLAAIAIQLTVPFSALVARLSFGERLSGWQIGGMVLAFAGVAVLGGEPERPTSGLHLLLVVAAGLAWAVGNVLVKRLGPVNVFALNAWIGLLAAPQLLLASLLLESGQGAALRSAGWSGWGAVVYMAVFSSILGYGLWYYLVDKHPLNKIVPLTLLSPVLAVVFAVLLLGEPLTWRIIVGGAVTLAGVAIIQLVRAVPAEPEQP
jgi:O-acetylserine/cysteine efflux transporter